MTSAAQGRRPQAAGIAADTPIQKVLHPTIADLYRGNVVVPGRFEPHRTAGSGSGSMRFDEFGE